MLSRFCCTSIIWDNGNKTEDGDKDITDIVDAGGDDDGYGDGDHHHRHKHHHYYQYNHHHIRAIQYVKNMIYTAIRQRYLGKAISSKYWEL